VTRPESVCVGTGKRKQPVSNFIKRTRRGRWQKKNKDEKLMRMRSSVRSSSHSKNSMRFGRNSGQP
jgi:hypothetical protein